MIVTTIIISQESQQNIELHKNIYYIFLTVLLLKVDRTKFIGQINHIFQIPK